MTVGQKDDRDNMRWRRSEMAGGHEEMPMDGEVCSTEGNVRIQKKRSETLPQVNKNGLSVNLTTISHLEKSKFR